jgi:hypothetical protein
MDGAPARGEGVGTAGEPAAAVGEREAAFGDKDRRAEVVEDADEGGADRALGVGGGDARGVEVAARPSPPLRAVAVDLQGPLEQARTVEGIVAKGEGRLGGLDAR